jgi:heparosan-N-sulfate-glucuronate 5-epimerase
MPIKWILSAIFICIFSVSQGQPPAVTNEEVWPDLPDTSTYQDIVKEGLRSYQEKKTNYAKRLQTYSPFNDYLNYGTTKSYSGGTIDFDEAGLPLKKYGNDYQYNPVTIAEFGLSQYGKHLSGGSETSLNLFYAAVNKLIDMEDPQGALRYRFAWKYYLTGETYQGGWVSGMAQGMALSVYSRAYHLTNDTKYLAAGEDALTFMLTPIENGGTLDTLEDLHPSLKNYIIIEEYLAEPSSYTLNGYMFSLLGLYDWWQLQPNQIQGSHAVARQYFFKGIETLVHILPYYDIGGFSAYDLGYITHKTTPHVSPTYHAVHIYLLHALASITKNLTLSETEKLWESYVNP